MFLLIFNVLITGGVLTYTDYLVSMVQFNLLKVLQLFNI